MIKKELYVVYAELIKTLKLSTYLGPSIVANGTPPVNQNCFSLNCSCNTEVSRRLKIIKKEILLYEDVVSEKRRKEKREKRKKN